jgi:hypothetical protein
MEYSRGIAPDADSALAGKWSARYAGDLFYAFDGRRARFELMFSEETRSAAQADSSAKLVSLPVNLRVLTNGEVTLRDQVGHAEIDEGTENFFKEVIAPLDAGVPQPGSYYLARYIDNVLNRTIRAELQDARRDSDYPNNNVMLLTFVNESNKTVTKWWIDLERGAIPIKLVGIKDGREHVRIYQEDLRFVGNKAWLPFRRVTAHGKIVTETIIREAQVGRVPDDSVFQLEFSAPSRVIDAVRSVRYSPDQTVFDLDNLPALDSPGTKRFTITEPPQNGRLSLPSEESARPPWVAPAAALGGFALLLAGVLALRRSRG